MDGQLQRSLKREVARVAKVTIFLQVHGFVLSVVSYAATSDIASCSRSCGILRQSFFKMLPNLSSEYAEGSRHATVTLDNNGAVLQIIALFLMVVTILATILRLILRVNVAHAAGSDDGLACLALVNNTGVGCTSFR